MQMKAKASIEDAPLCVVRLFAHNGTERACYGKLNLNVELSKFEELVGASLDGAGFPPLLPVSASYTDKDGTTFTLNTTANFEDMIDLIKEVRTRAGVTRCAPAAPLSPDYTRLAGEHAHHRHHRFQGGPGRGGGGGPAEAER